METLVIRGGYPLHGTIDISGAKNSALPLMAASVLAAGRSVILNCPDISDVEAAAAILRHLGCAVERSGSAVVMDCAAACGTGVPPRLMKAMRSSVTFLGALLGRFGHAEMTLPGGCPLGERPINYHISALESLGVTSVRRGDTLIFDWRVRHGGIVTLPFPSVGATENTLLAASAVAEPVTIRNAAREPEICELAQFLSAMGAEIVGAGTDTIRVRGGMPLSGACRSVQPDRIETATYLAAAAACGGDVTLRKTDFTLLLPVISVLRKAGCTVDTERHAIRIRRFAPLRAVGIIRTEVYPGFPTDAQAPLMAALLRAEGQTVFCESVFPDRFRHAAELRRFGADITVEGSCAAVRGVQTLHGAEATATDLRGGAGVVIAALCADGESRVSALPVIRRGYADLEEKLRSLGASVFAAD